MLRCRTTKALAHEFYSDNMPQNNRSDREKRLALILEWMSDYAQFLHVTGKCPSLLSNMRKELGEQDED